jgi:hypothetical protein
LRIRDARVSTPCVIPSAAEGPRIFLGMMSSERAELTPSQQMCRAQHSVCARAANVKIVKAVAIVFSVAIGAWLLVLNARAQQPTPLPHVQLAIPVAPPRGWDAKMWANVRARCQGIADRIAAHLAINREEMMEGRGICMDYVPSPPAATQQVPQPQPTFGGAPRPTPVPLVGPQSLAPYGNFRIGPS